VQRFLCKLCVNLCVLCGKKNIENQADFSFCEKKILSLQEIILTKEKMENLQNLQQATPESVWALLEKFSIEAEKSRIEAEKRMKKLEELTGSLANNQGSFAEEYFFNSFEDGKQNFFGEEFDEIDKSVKGIEKGFKDEYDILLINGKSIGIIEIKFKAHENDIPKVLRKAETFRENFPKYKNHGVYLGLASMSFYPELEQECINQGIAIIKQVGDTVIINDTNLKVF